MSCLITACSISPRRGVVSALRRASVSDQSFRWMAAACLALTTGLWAPSSRAAAPTTLIAQHSGMCLDIAYASKDDAAPVIQWTCHGGSNQEWTWKPAAGGNNVVNVNSGKCLDVPSGSNQPGTAIGQNSCDGSNQQVFAWSNGLLKHKSSGLCVDIFGARQDAGTKAVLWHCGAGANQVFAARKPPPGGDPDTPHVRYVYMVPKDVAFECKAYAAVAKSAANITAWYKTQFSGNAPDYSIEWLRGDQDANWYVYHATYPNQQQTWRALSNTSNEVFSKLGDPRQKTNIRYTIFLHESAPWKDTQGTGIDGQYTFLSYEDIDMSIRNVPRAYLGIAHEQGHMWGLPHQGPNEDCMQFGFYENSCNYAQINRNQVLRGSSSGYFFANKTGQRLGVQAGPGNCVP